MPKDFFAVNTGQLPSQTDKHSIMLREARDYLKKNAESSSEKKLPLSKEVIKRLQEGYYHYDKDKADNWDKLINPAPNLSALPRNSFFLRATFDLERPYLSRHDNPFHFHDNPLRRDKVSGLPIIPGSAWKGALRWVFGRTHGEEGRLEGEERKRAIELFGTESAALAKFHDDGGPQDAGDDEGAFRRGRLNFYSTFFRKTSVEVINPHERKTRKGTFPIYFDAVPRGSVGIFRLLYIPFDLMAMDGDELEKQTRGDADAVLKAVNELLNLYGTSAKRSSGYGVMRTIKADGENIFLMRAVDGEVKEVREEAEDRSFESCLPIDEMLSLWGKD